MGLAGAPSAPVVAVPSVVPSVAAPSGVALSGAGVVSLSLCTIVPPAPNSIMFTAQSRHATRWRHGSRTTSRGDDKQRRHSDDGSSSVVVGGTAGG